MIIDVLRFLGKRNISMYKKTYEKPTMTIVGLQQRAMLLSGSILDVKRDAYGKANEEIDSSLLDENDEWVWE